MRKGDPEYFDLFLLNLYPPDDERRKEIEKRIEIREEKKMELKKELKRKRKSEIRRKRLKEMGLQYATDLSELEENE